MEPIQKEPFDNTQIIQELFARSRGLEEERKAQMDNLIRAAQAARVDPMLAFASGLSKGRTYLPGQGNSVEMGNEAAMKARADNAKLATEVEKFKLSEVGDAQTKTQALLPGAIRGLSLSNRKGSGGKLPNGNEWVKQGTRMFEVIPDKSPEGYRLKEIVGAEKAILGANEAMSEAKQMVKMKHDDLDARGFFDRMTPSQYEKWVFDEYEKAHRFVNATSRSASGMVANPNPNSNPEKNTVAPTVPDAPDAPVAAAAPVAPVAAVAPVAPTDPIGKVKERRDGLPVLSPERMAANQEVIGTKAEMARREVNSKGSEEAALKDYTENILPAARSASSMLTTIAGLRAIPKDPGAFAKWRAEIGAALADLGYKGDITKDAANYESARGLLQKVANDVLMAAKGVQTEGDAQRAFQQFMQLKDTPAAGDFLMKWAEELAERAKFKGEFYRAHNAEKKTWQGAEEAWNKNSDLANAAPVKLIKGVPRTYTEYKKVMVQKYPDMNIKDILKNWNAAK